MKLEKSILGAGCFWHVEEFFSKIKGVVATRVGYACGNSKNPTYKKVCTGITGHIEVVEITFDTKLLKFDELLKQFWSIHDPTSLDKQGPDIGTQYRSVICVINNVQEEIAEKSKKNIQHKFKKKIVTQICHLYPNKFFPKPCEKFYPAENYHQKYLKKKYIYMYENCDDTPDL